MEVLEDLFSKDKEIVDKLKENAMILDFKKILFEHLGPELNKLFEAKKNKVILKNFLEECQYEYGFFNKGIDLERAFSLYKKYADQNDFYCMYKMHLIYLCEYDKFKPKKFSISELSIQFPFLENDCLIPLSINCC